MIGFLQFVEGTVLPDATPGDLSFVFPYRHLSSIIEMLQALEQLAPGLKI